MNGDPGQDGLEIAILVDDPAWRADLPDAQALVRRAVRHALGRIPEASGLGRAAEVTVVLSGDAAVRALNCSYRGRDKATNVLSFAALEGAAGPSVPELPRLLGDIVLARQTILGEAAAQGKPVADHVVHLVVHGLLHLLGYDHLDAGDAARMEALEVAILGDLGVPDPYRPAGGAQRDGANPRC